MHTSRFHLGLIATLAAGLGYSFRSSDAVGYPAGAVVSLGTNPVWSAGGQLVGTASDSVLIVPSDQTLVVTDVHIALGSPDSQCFTSVQIGLGDGDSTGVSTANLGRFSVGLGSYAYARNAYHPIQSVNLGSGIAVSPGDTLKIHSELLSLESCAASNVRTAYTLSGYYAQP